ncbi:jg3953 [Pararge aegeria aegeria]|uniref:Jg3953 protein n=1 Tax=Pararge aegeria aegeria TaxID=348720 RepID=A0A8S4RTB1_9NEOP|nr:jg3953 [Pararge aegeria aegeria]
MVIGPEINVLLPNTMASVCVAFFSFFANDLALSLPALFARKMVNLAAEAADLNLRLGVEMRELLLSRLSFFL